MADDTTDASTARGDPPQAADGKFEEKYSDDDVLQLLDESYPEPMSATEIAERLGFSRATAHNRLHRLLEQEGSDLRSKKIGARARIWWVTPEEGDD